VCVCVCVCVCVRAREKTHLICLNIQISSRNLKSIANKRPEVTKMIYLCTFCNLF